MEDEPTMNELLEAFNVPEDKRPQQEPTQDGDPGEPTPTEPQEPQEPQQDETPKNEETEEPQQETTEETQESSKPDPQDKINQAFAQMRVENKNLKQTLQGVAEVLGVDANDPQKVNEALQEKIINAKAQQQNVDPKLLSELELLKQKDQQREMQEIQREAYMGFQSVKDEFGVEDKDLQAFADQLIADGVNPFEQRVDLRTAYIQKNYQALLEKAREEGARKEAERQKNTEETSTTPSDKTGQPAGEPAKINSVTELNSYFKNQGITE